MNKVACVRTSIYFNLNYQIHKIDYNQLIYLLFEATVSHKTDFLTYIIIIVLLQDAAKQNLKLHNIKSDYH